MTGPHYERLDGISSRIDLSPHPPNQYFLCTPTGTAYCAGPVSLSVQVLPGSYVSPSPQSIRSFYAERHRILHRYHESFRLSSTQFFRFPRVTPTALTAAPLSLSILVGGVVFLPGPSFAPRTPLPRCICLFWLGGLLLIHGPPHAPQTFMSLSALVGRDGFDQAPLAHP